MSVSIFEGSTENLFDFLAVTGWGGNQQCADFWGITIDLEVYVSRKSNNEDSTDGIFDPLSSISDLVQEEFNGLISGDNDKKHFLWVLSRIFTLLLNTKVDLAEKIKRILKIAIETTLKILQEPKPL